ncbi:MAG: hypothetical protein WAO88_14260, partial [Roseicyclus sp.]|uniref:hypothetical protein n=1 Tax=Roseicyclus sp. TaxID=1914329 RepID=UPI003BB1113F
NFDTGGVHDHVLPKTPAQLVDFQHGFGPLSAATGRVNTTSPGQSALHVAALWQFCKIAMTQG